MRSEHIAFVDSFDLNVNRIGFEGKHKIERKKCLRWSWHESTYTKDRQKNVDDVAWILNSEYWIRFSQWLVGIIVAHKMQSYTNWRQRKNRRKKTHVSRFVRRPFHRCCLVIRLLRALDFGTIFFLFCALDLASLRHNFAFAIFEMFRAAVLFSLVPPHSTALAQYNLFILPHINCVVNCNCNCNHYTYRGRCKTKNIWKIIATIAVAFVYCSFFSICSLFFCCCLVSVWGFFVCTSFETKTMHNYVIWWQRSRIRTQSFVALQ